VMTALGKVFDVVERRREQCKIGLRMLLVDIDQQALQHLHDQTQAVVLLPDRCRGHFVSRHVHHPRHLTPRRVVVHDDTVRGPFEIVELTALQRPPEQRADCQHQHHAQWYEQIEYFHFGRVERQSTLL